MQSSAITFSPSLPLLKPRRPPSSTFTSGCSSIRLSSSVSATSKDVGDVNNVGISSSWPRRSWTLSSSPFSSSKLRPWTGVSSLSSDADASPFKVQATAVPDSSEEGAGAGNNIGKTLELGLLFGLWFIFNIYFNIYNKQVLKVFPFPVTVTAVQFAVGTVLVLLMWGLNLYKKPKISGAQLAAILPLAFVHTLGNLFTNMSLGKVAVSFTHTIKAMEPFFSVILSAMFLGEAWALTFTNYEKNAGAVASLLPIIGGVSTLMFLFVSLKIPTPWVVGSLLPIVGGVVLASATEASFNWAGFWSAMASNLTNQSRNVLSKKVMVNKEESIDNITLFSIITIMSFFLLSPVAIFMEGVKFTPAYVQSAGLNVNQIYTRSLLAALCFHAYQQVSYMILQRVSPVTHSVGNCVKRVVVIVSSVIFFRTPVSPINSIGTGIALAGVFLYSRVKRIKAKPKTA